MRGQDQCWLWGASKTKKGYGRFKFEGRRQRAHRFAWQSMFGRIPAGLHVLHSCDTPSCCNPAHLFLGTNRDNMTDRNQKGRQAKGDRNGTRSKPWTRPRGENHPSITKPWSRPRGERHSRSKLTWEQVQKIRQEYTRGVLSQNGLAVRYGVSRSAIEAIVQNRTWNPTHANTL